MKNGLFIGVMSGTSMDGLDVAACSFEKEKFRIVAAHTFAFPKSIKSRLSQASQLSTGALANLDSELGRFIGETVSKFLHKKNSCDLAIAIASHGHTVVHAPTDGYTLQIGNGAQMAISSELPCIVDFRSNDVAAGGQGAPLAPIGDLHLFRDYHFCLNLGGITNISVKTQPDTITGFDICGCNLILNELARQMDLAFDENGNLAKEGKVNKPLLVALQSNFELPGPGFSLDASEAKEFFFKVANQYSSSPSDLLATAVAFISQAISKVIQSLSDKMETKQKLKCLVTGGGAHNGFLVSQLKTQTEAEIVVPDPQTVDYKEALIFAYLGWLRWQGKVNCLASVTGATKDTIGGAVYLP